MPERESGDGRSEPARTTGFVGEAPGVEHAYRTLARNFPNGAIALFDDELRFTLVEGRGLEALGLSSEELEGKTIWEALPPEVARAAEPSYRAALRGESITMERSLNGRTYLVQTAPLTSQTGEVIAGMLVSLDITERKRGEDVAMKQLGEAQSKYQTLVEQLPAVVYQAEFGESGVWHFVSPQVERLLGFPAQEWIGNPDLWFARIHPEDRARVMEAEANSRETGEPFVSEYRLVARDERIVWVHDEARVLTDAGVNRLVQGILVDITERKRAQEALESLNQDLERRVAERTAELEAANGDLVAAKEAAERANMAKSEFLSRTSHELRTPLNAILGFGQLLDTSSLEPDDRESVEQILKGGRHLLDLINEVLDISRIESSRLFLSIEPVSLHDVVQETVDLVLPLGVGSGIEITASLAKPPKYVLADRQRLKQVLLNLLSNAIKYNRLKGSVVISCGASSGESVTLRVSDTGLGILPENMERLFSPFERLGAERTGAEGTGLGLALSRALIEAMGGSIFVESEVGRGSTFSIELPAGRDPSVDLGPPESDEVTQPGVSDVKTVLYIEDNLANLSLVERILVRRSSVRLLAAMQGRLGLELAQEHQPDLVLLDLHLPDMSGEETFRSLKAHRRTENIPVIVISADSTPGQMDRMLSAGVDEYLTKPFDVRRFLEVIDRALESRAG